MWGAVGSKNMKNTENRQKSMKNDPFLIENSQKPNVFESRIDPEKGVFSKSTVLSFFQNGLRCNFSLSADCEIDIVHKENTHSILHTFFSGWFWPKGGHFAISQLLLKPAF